MEKHLLPEPEPLTRKVNLTLSERMFRDLGMMAGRYGQSKNAFLRSLITAQKELMESE